jgi:hypothetical protein
MDARPDTHDHSVGGRAYLVKDMPGYEGMSWWWCEECLRKRGMIW